MSPQAAQRVGTAVAAALAAMVAILVAMTPVAEAQSPADVRACVERNGARYADPRSAVDAQYADIEDACRAALDDGTTVDFAVDPATGGDRRTAGAAPSASDGGSGTGGGSADSGTTQTEQPSSPRAHAGSTRHAAGVGRGDSSAVAAPRTDPRTVRAVAAAIQDNEGAGAPVPSSLSGAPAWLWALLACAGAAAVGAAAVAVSRRLR